MKFKRHLNITGPGAWFFLVPLVNLVLILLMFLAINWRSMAQPGLALELPALLTSGMVTFEEGQIRVGADNAFYWGNVSVTEEELKSVLAKIALRKESLLIRADSRAALGRLARVWDLARQAGIKRVYLASEEKL